jgi:hypothetical protein
MEKIFAKIEMKDRKLQFSLQEGDFFYRNCYQQEEKIQTGNYLVGIFLKEIVRQNTNIKEPIPVVVSCSGYEKEPENTDNPDFSDELMFGLSITISKPDGNFLTNRNIYFLEQEGNQEISIVLP